MARREDGPEKAETERLQKYLARCGVCSRREAERLVEAGRVKVNREVVSHPGTPIRPGKDVVEVDDLEVAIDRMRYVVLHKPTGYVTSRKDPQGRPTVYELLPPELQHLHYVGRLDLTTTGVLLLTNDGELSYRLTRPEYRVQKRYEVKIRGSVDEQVLTRMRRGIEDRGERLRAEDARVVQRLRTNTLVEVVLTEGKNREVRRLVEAQGEHVVRLSRTAFAGLTVEGLEPGAWRELTAAEVQALHAACGLGDGGEPC